MEIIMTEVAIPAGAKRPADHLSAVKADAENEPIKVEFDGEHYEVEPEAFADVLVLDMLADMEDGRSTLLPRVVRTLLGVEQWAMFVKSHTDAKGRVSATHLTGLFEALDAAAGKSQSSPSS